MTEAEQLTTMTFCCRVQRPDGAGYAVTSHDRSLAIGSVMYRASPGMLPKAVVRSLDPDETGTEIEGAIGAGPVGKKDVLAGRWDGAEIHFLATDWERPGAADIPLIRGKLGDLSFQGKTFSAELSGPASSLGRTPCPVLSPECRAEFGGPICRVDMRGRSIRKTVVKQYGEWLVLEPGLLSDGYSHGQIRWLTGLNAGLRGVVLAVETDRIKLRERPRSTVGEGDQLLIYEGCDKRLQTCVQRFENGANFRGEPHLPGNDFLAG